MSEWSRTSRRLSQPAAVELAHALVGQVLLETAARALLIKGPVASMQGLRPVRMSADVDVLVEGTAIERVCDALRARGWHPPVMRDVPYILGPHSTTLIHDEWPCAIDVHHWFPGVLAGPREAFEALWDIREPYELAHRIVFAPGRPGMALILALHALRSPSEGRSRAEIPRLKEIFESEFSEPENRQLREIAMKCRSAWIVRGLLSGTSGFVEVDDATDEEKRLWELTQLGTVDKSAFLWHKEAAEALRSGQLWRLWRAVWVRRADVPRSLVSQLPTHREHWSYQVERWKRGLRVLSAQKHHDHRG